MPFVDAKQLQSVDIPKVRPAFRLPETAGKPTKKYVVGLKPDAPIHSIALGGINFDKYTFPKSASYLENQGKYFPTNIIRWDFTDEQVQALRERSKIVDVKWRDENDVLHTGWASDFIILAPADNYNPALAEGYKPENAGKIAGEEPKIPGEEKEKPPDVSEMNVKEMIYETQRKRDKK